MDNPTPTATRSFSRHAAMLSWVCPVISVIILILVIFSGHMVARRIIPFIVMFALLLIAVGFIFGVLALFGISMHGTKGILAPAIVGIIINGSLILFFVMIYLSERASPIHPYRKIQAPPVADICLLGRP
jgi:hypothetical protein